MYQWVNVHLKKKRLYVFTWGCCWNHSASLSPSWRFLTLKGTFANDWETYRISSCFSWPLRFRSSDAHATCLNPMLAEDSKIFGFNWRNVRKKCWEMFGAFRFVLHDILSHIHLLGQAIANIAADFWPLLHREYLFKYRLLGRDRVP